MIDDAHPVEPALPPAIALPAPDDVVLRPVARPARSGRPGYLPDRSGMSPPRRLPTRPRVTQGFRGSGPARRALDAAGGPPPAVRGVCLVPGRGRIGAGGRRAAVAHGRVSRRRRPRAEGPRQGRPAAGDEPPAAVPPDAGSRPEARRRRW